MNFSGNRYTREQLRGFLDKSGVETFVLDCEDSFGSYGTIGFRFGRVLQEVCMTDLMFSCRIQAKRVEHSFVAYLLRKYRRATSGDFFVNYRKTAKNAAPGKEFDDLGFLPLSESDGFTRLVFPRSSEVLEDGIVTIIDASVDVGAGSAVPTAVGSEPHSAKGRGPALCAMSVGVYEILTECLRSAGLSDRVSRGRRTELVLFIHASD